jgi:type II secretory pathway pseudopilin PulG
LRRESGYTLVVCAVAVTVLSIAVATALPLWSAQIRREREEEMIFRGFQYAEAIRVFQKRFGRYPTRLEELIEIEPRSIRRLWKDPLTEDGEWGLILATGGEGRRPRRGQKEGQPPEPPMPPSQLDPLPEGEEGEGEGPATGPIVGVHSRSEKSGFHVLFGQERHKDWKFTAELLAAVGGGDPNRVPTVPRAAWVGRPFRGAPHGAPVGGQQVGMPSAPQTPPAPQKPPGEDK